MKIITDLRCTEYSRSGHPERPQRILRTVERLKKETDLALEWEEPLALEGDELLLRAHRPEHLAHLKNPILDFDADTPSYPNIDEHARLSVGGALKALQLAGQGEMAFSLMRPPGHHATRDQAMGFCYLNSIAIAVLQALEIGYRRVAVFDFDVHHGNGTEAILMGNPQCEFYSIHQYPGYPGTGTESVQNCYNYPMPPGSSREAYRGALEQALERMAAFQPDIIAVSAGFDAYRRDPLADEPLEAEDFRWLGDSVRRLGVPVFSVLEGGYSSDLPELIYAYLCGLDGRVSVSAGG